jgi:hypothetical protein
VKKERLQLEDVDENDATAANYTAAAAREADFWEELKAGDLQPAAPLAAVAVPALRLRAALGRQLT